MIEGLKTLARFLSRYALLKWVIYLVLAVNLGEYLIYDLNIADSIDRKNSSAIDLLVDFSMSITALAFLLILLVLELQTSDKVFMRKRRLRGLYGYLRIFCIALIAIAFTGYVQSVLTTFKVSDRPPVEDLCQLAGTDVNVVYNQEYTAVLRSNCEILMGDEVLYWVGDDNILATANGLALERFIVSVEFLEALAWIVLLIAIEFTVVLVGKSEVTGARIRGLYYLKLVLYGMLLLFAATWAYLGFVFYFFDALVWVAAYMMIELNLVRNWPASYVNKETRGDTIENKTNNNLCMPDSGWLLKRTSRGRGRGGRVSRAAVDDRLL